MNMCIKNMCVRCGLDKKTFQYGLCFDCLKVELDQGRKLIDKIRGLRDVVGTCRDKSLPCSHIRGVR